jgi:hypothetical protein
LGQFSRDIHARSGYREDKVESWPVLNPLAAVLHMQLFQCQVVLVCRHFGIILLKGIAQSHLEDRYRLQHVLEH